MYVLYPFPHTVTHFKKKIFLTLCQILPLPLVFNAKTITFSLIFPVTSYLLCTESILREMVRLFFYLFIPYLHRYRNLSFGYLFHLLVRFQYTVLEDFFFKSRGERRARAFECQGLTAPGHLLEKKKKIANAVLRCTYGGYENETL